MSGTADMVCPAQPSPARVWGCVSSRGGGLGPGGTGYSPRYGPQHRAGLHRAGTLDARSPRQAGEAFAQRASTVLAFNGVAPSVVIVGLAAPKDVVTFDVWIKLNVIVIVVLLLRRGRTRGQAVAGLKATAAEGLLTRSRGL